MTFLHPLLAAAGIACVAIPIIIHLLMRRRRKPVMWGAMRFLLEAYRKHKRRLRLEQILLLAARCLLVALIAMALARPMLGAAGVLGGRQATTLYLLIDNSLTSSALGTDGQPALESHKRRALEAIAQLDGSSGDRVAIITMGGPAEPMVIPPSSDLSAARRLIDDLESTDSAMDLAGAAERVRAQFSETGNEAGRSLVLVLSDFLSGSADLERPLPMMAQTDDAVVLVSPPAATGADNISVTAVVPLRSVIIAESDVEDENAGSASSIRVALSRSGPGVSGATTTTLRIRILGADGGEATTTMRVQWKPGEAQTSRIVNLSAAPSPGRGVVLVEASPDAIAGDDVFRRPIEVRRSLRAAIIAPRRLVNSQGLNPEDSADWLRVALSPILIDRELFTGGDTSGDIEIVTIDPASLDAARLADIDAVFVAHPDMIEPDDWSRLAVLAQRGGLVVVTPPAGEGISIWADAFTTAFDLDWTIGRESREHETALGLSSDRTSADERDLLAMIAAEFQDLARSVRIFKSLSISFPSESGERVIDLDSGEPFVVAATPGGESSADRGLVVLFGSALAASWTDLPTQPMFLPLTQELLRQGIGRAAGSWTSVAGRPVSIPAAIAELRADDGTTRSTSRPAPMRDSGLWRAYDARGTERGLIAINPDAAAGRTDAHSPDALRTWLGQLSTDPVRFLADDNAPATTLQAGSVTLGQILTDQPDDAKASLPLLIAALALAVLEVAMARWFSHASIAPGRPEAGAVA